MTAQPVTIEQLERLASACTDAIGSNPDVARVAIPYLHILSAHPVSTAIYGDLLEGRSPLKRRLYNAFARLGLKTISLFEPAEMFAGDPLPPKVDVLFVSHFLRPSQAASGEDLYFGDIPNALNRLGITSAVAMINQSRSPWRRLRDKWIHSGTNRILLNRTFGIGKEFALSRRLMSQSTALLNRADKSSTAFYKQFLRHAAANAGSSGSMTALRIAEQAGELVRRLRPKAIVTTYEGHSWERLVYHAARAADPDIRCIGYHHAMLFPFPDAMTRRIGPEFDPDVILTAGIPSRDWLRSQPRLLEIPVEILGSVRTTKAVASPHADATSSACLILPEGLIPESVMLARCGVEAARVLKNVMFKIRLHPLLTPRDIVKAAPDLRELPANVTWSAGSLQDDLTASRWALYRGTTAIVPAILAGLKPIYLEGQIADAPRFDPLDALPCWRDNAPSARHLVTLLIDDIAKSDEERQVEFDKAAAYCETCFMPIEMSVIQWAISSPEGK